MCLTVSEVVQFYYIEIFSKMIEMMMICVLKGRFIFGIGKSVTSCPNVTKTGLTCLHVGGAKEGHTCRLILLGGLL